MPAWFPSVMAEPHIPDHVDSHVDRYHEVASDIDVFDSEIERQQLELIYSQAPVSIFMAFVLVALMTSALWSVVNHSTLLMWFGAQAVQTALRLLLVRQYRRAAEDTKNGPRWMLLFFAGTFVAGIVWGCIGLQFSYAWPVEYQMLMLMGLAGVMAGAISSYAVNLSVYIAFLVPTVLIPAQSLLVYSSAVTSSLGLMMLLFSAAMLMIARNYNHNAVKLLHIRLSNQHLLDEMTRVNASLENEIVVRRDAEHSLRSDQQLFSNGPIVVFRWSVEAGWPIEYVSSTVDQFGYDAGRLMSERRQFSELIHRSDLQRVMDAELVAGRSGVLSANIDYRLVDASGEVRWVYDYTTAIYDERGELTHYLGYLIDISERKYSEFELQQEKERAQVTLHSIADAVITTDVNGQIEYMNPSAEVLTGWECMLARGMPVARVFRLLDKLGNEPAEDPLSLAMNLGAPVQSQDDNLIRNRAGEEISVRYSASPILTASGTALGVILVFHDVTHTRHMEEKISYQASHDALTGLLNRAEFERQLGSLIQSRLYGEDQHVVCVLDVDQLKVINDTCSHESGDRLLVKVAELLQDCVRETDYIARLGGDEFGVLLCNCSLVSAARLVEEMLVALRALRFASCGRVFEVGVSIGMAHLKPGCEGTSHIMSEADMACYMAKERGGSRYHIYQTTDTELARRHEEMQWVSRISEAIDNDRLVLYYQQIVPLGGKDEDGVHFEVLVRMYGDNDELVTPDKFLPAAERFHVVSGIDRWVVSHSLAWYSKFREQHGQEYPDTMSINLSGVSITDAKVLSHIKAEMRKYGVRPEVLCFEITETAAVANLSAATNFIRELRRLGCRFSLDDFGSGLSSFAYLKRLPVDYLKIDGTFVRNMDNDDVDRAMVSAVQQLASTLGMLTIAEFVSNDRILELLTGMGVDYAQGYAIAKPAPLDSFTV